jgi:hypothetical protein
MDLSKIFTHPIQSFMLLCWLVTSLYIGIGGYVFTENKMQIKLAIASNDTIPVVDVKTSISYCNQAHLDAAKEQMAILEIYPMYKNLPDSIIFLLTVFGFGIVGTVTFMLKQIALDDVPPEKVKFITLPILGMLTGSGRY